MAGNRNSAERVDKLKHPDELLDTREFERVKISDTHDRLGTFLSDVRDGTEKHLGRYTTEVDREYYPVGSGSNEDLVIILLNATAGAPDPTNIPAVDTMYEIQSVRMVGNGAYAANRTAQLNIRNAAGTMVVPIWYANGNLITGLEDVPIFPVDASTYMTGAVAVIGLPGVPYNGGYYLELDTTGLAALEELDMYVLIRRKYIGGLRE